MDEDSQNQVVKNINSYNQQTAKFNFSGQMEKVKLQGLMIYIIEYLLVLPIPYLTLLLFITLSPTSYSMGAGGLDNLGSALIGAAILAITIIIASIVITFFTWRFIRNNNNPTEDINVNAKIINKLNVIYGAFIILIIVLTYIVKALINSLDDSAIIVVAFVSSSLILLPTLFYTLRHEPVNTTTIKIIFKNILLNILVTVLLSFIFQPLLTICPIIMASVPIMIISLEIMRRNYLNRKVRSDLIINEENHHN